ncbi:MAG: PSD1 domain-containing protein [Candidatus Solibacter usitatus]|nr:PSD1 domain-containing protein [Candidatus Solibacter usitatus]
MRILAGLLLPMVCLAQRVDPVEFFESKVRPVLAKNCFSCHTSTKMGGLEMVSRESFLKGGGSGPAISIDRPDDSLLLKAINYSHDRLKMPPSGKLSAAEIKDITSWIYRGAVWPIAKSDASAKTYVITDQQRAWWSFQPVRKHAPPAVKDKAWVKDPIDQFVLASLEAKGLRPVAAASKHDWIRRITYDLTGLPPKMADVEAYLRDTTPHAKAAVVDRLLASKQYGERWGRYWLDVARYSDDLLNSTQDQPYDNAYRYRDWVIQAFNDDMPYTTFVKAQLAGDQIADKEKYVAGLGFYALSPQFQDDRVDVTSKAFLALTVACATCHDHKFDPIPTKDYYSLLGVFTSTAEGEYPLAPPEVVETYKQRTKAVEQQQAKLTKFLESQAKALSEVLAERTADYLRAARKVEAGEKPDVKLDAETLDRWVAYLKMPAHEHSFVDGWRDEAKLPAELFRKRVLDLLAEQKNIEEQNFIRLGGSNARNDLSRADLLSLPREKWIFWRDLFSNQRFGKFESGLFYYKEKKIDRFLTGEWKAHLDQLNAGLASFKKAVPERYDYYHIIKDREKPRNERIRVRGSTDNLGEEAPRGFLTVLHKGEKQIFQKGSGRLELAEAIARADNPLTARVMANRVWHHLFGAGLVRTLSNFGQLGEKPSHPELLDHVASRLVDNGWSLKKLIRELALSSTYALSYQSETKAFTADPDNRLLWRANRRRLDIESLRDSLLAASGELDESMGGKPLKVADEKNKRRTVYGFVSRRKLDGTLALFDFPNPNSTSEQRMPTATPVQQLFFLNGKFLMERGDALSARLEKESSADSARIRAAYRLLFCREPEKAEIDAGLAYLKSKPNAWPEYAQVLFSSNEFVFY